jgi:hypothetical protein
MSDQREKMTGFLSKLNNILCAEVVCAVSAAFGVRRGAACFFTHARCRQTQQYALRTATPCVFGASSAFRWNVSVEKKFGLLLQCANLHLRCAEPSILRAPASVLLAPNAPPFFVLVPQQ